MCASLRAFVMVGIVAAVCMLHLPGVVMSWEVMLDESTVPLSTILNPDNTALLSGQLRLGVVLVRPNGSAPFGTLCALRTNTGATNVVTAGALSNRDATMFCQASGLMGSRGKGLVPPFGNATLFSTAETFSYGNWSGSCPYVPMASPTTSSFVVDACLDSVMMVVNGSTSGQQCPGGAALGVVCHTGVLPPTVESEVVLALATALGAAQTEATAIVALLLNQSAAMSFPPIRHASSNATTLLPTLFDDLLNRASTVNASARRVTSVLLRSAVKSIAYQNYTALLVSVLLKNDSLAESPSSSAYYPALQISTSMPNETTLWFRSPLSSNAWSPACGAYQVPVAPSGSSSSSGFVYCDTPLWHAALAGYPLSPSANGIDAPSKVVEFLVLTNKSSNTPPSSSSSWQESGADGVSILVTTTSTQRGDGSPLLLLGSLHHVVSNVSSDPSASDELAAFAPAGAAVTISETEFVTVLEAANSSRSFLVSGSSRGNIQSAPSSVHELRYVAVNESTVPPASDGIFELNPAARVVMATFYTADDFYTVAAEPGELYWNASSVVDAFGLSVANRLKTTTYLDCANVSASVSTATRILQDCADDDLCVGLITANRSMEERVRCVIRVYEAFSAGSSFFAASFASSSSFGGLRQDALLSEPSLIYLQVSKLLVFSLRIPPSVTSGVMSFAIQGDFGSTLDIFVDGVWEGSCVALTSSELRWNASSSSCAESMPFQRCDMPSSLLLSNTSIVALALRAKSFRNVLPCHHGFAVRVMATLTASYPSFAAQVASLRSLPFSSALDSLLNSVAATTTPGSSPTSRLVVAQRSVQIPGSWNLSAVTGSGINLLVQGAVAVMLEVSQAALGQADASGVTFGLQTVSTASFLPPIVCGSRTGFASGELLGMDGYPFVSFPCASAPSPVSPQGDALLIQQQGTLSGEIGQLLSQLNASLQLTNATLSANASTLLALLERLNTIKLTVTVVLDSALFPAGTSDPNLGFAVLKNHPGSFQYFLAKPESESFSKHVRNFSGVAKLVPIPISYVIQLSGNVMYHLLWSGLISEQETLSGNARLACTLDAVSFPHGGECVVPVPSVTSRVRVRVQNANLWQPDQVLSVHTIHRNGSLISNRALIGGSRPFADGTVPAQSDESCLTFPVAAELEFSLGDAQETRLVVVAPFALQRQVNCLFAAVLLFEFSQDGEANASTCLGNNNTAASVMASTTPSRNFLCSGECVALSAVCDGFSDCALGDDEAFCDSWSIIETNQSLAFSSGLVAMEHAALVENVSVSHWTQCRAVAVQRTAEALHGSNAIAATADAAAQLLSTSFLMFEFDEDSGRCATFLNQSFLLTQFLRGPSAFLTPRNGSALYARLPDGPVAYPRCDSAISCSGHGTAGVTIWAGVPFCHCVCDAGWSGSSCSHAQSLLQGSEQVLVGFNSTAALQATTLSSLSRVLASLSGLPLTYDCGPFFRKGDVVGTLCSVVDGDTSPWLPFSPGNTILGLLQSLILPPPVSVGVAPFPQAQQSMRHCSAILPASTFVACVSPTSPEVPLGALVLVLATSVPVSYVNVSFGLGVLSSRRSGGAGGVPVDVVSVSFAPRLSSSDSFSMEMRVGVFVTTCTVNVSALLGQSSASAVNLTTATAAFVESFNVTVQDANENLIPAGALLAPPTVSWNYAEHLPLVTEPSGLLNVEVSIPAYLRGFVALLVVGIILLLSAALLWYAFRATLGSLLTSAEMSRVAPVPLESGGGVAVGDGLKFSDLDGQRLVAAVVDGGGSEAYKFARTELILDDAMTNGHGANDQPHGNEDSLSVMPPSSWRALSITSFLAAMILWVAAVVCLLSYYTVISYESNVTLLVELYADAHCDQSLATPIPYALMAISAQSSRECLRRNAAGQVGIGGFSQGWCKRNSGSSQMLAFFVFTGTYPECSRVNVKHATWYPTGVCHPRSAVQFAKFTCGHNSEVAERMAVAARRMSTLQGDVVRIPRTSIPRTLLLSSHYAPQEIFLTPGVDSSQANFWAYVVPYERQGLRQEALSRTSPSDVVTVSALLAADSSSFVGADGAAFVLQRLNESFLTPSSYASLSNSSAGGGSLLAAHERLLSLTPNHLQLGLIATTPDLLGEVPVASSSLSYLPVGDVFNEYGTVRARSGVAANVDAAKYFGVAGTSADIGHWFDSLNGPDGSESYISMYLRLSETSSGFAFVLADGWVDAATDRSPIVTQAIQVINRASYASGWFSDTYTLYGSLFADGFTHSLRYVFADPGEGGAVSVLEWSCDAIGASELFNGLWHHVVISFRRDNGLTKAQLVVDGTTSRFDPGWNQCVRSKMPSMADHVANQTDSAWVYASTSDGSGSATSSYVYDSPILWVGHFNGGVAQLQFHSATYLSLFDLWLQTTEAIRARNPLNRIAYQALGGVLVSAAAVLFTTTLYMAIMLHYRAQGLANNSAVEHATAFVTYVLTVYGAQEESSDNDSPRDAAFAAECQSNVSKPACKGPGATDARSTAGPYATTNSYEEVHALARSSGGGQSTRQQRIHVQKLANIPYRTACRWLGFSDAQMNDFLGELERCGYTPGMQKVELIKSLYGRKSGGSFVVPTVEEWNALILSDDAEKIASEEDPVPPLAVLAARSNPSQLAKMLLESATESRTGENKPRAARTPEMENRQLLFSSVQRALVAVLLTTRGLGNETNNNDEREDDGADDVDGDRDAENKVLANSKRSGRVQTGANIGEGVASEVLQVITSAVGVLQIVSAWTSAVVLPTGYLDSIGSFLNVIAIDFSRVVPTGALVVPIAQFVLASFLYCALMYVIFMDRDAFATYAAKYIAVRCFAPRAEPSPTSSSKQRVSTATAAAGLRRGAADAPVVQPSDVGSLAAEFAIAPRNRLRTDIEVVALLPKLSCRRLDEALHVHESNEEEDGKVQPPATVASSASLPCRTVQVPTLLEGRKIAVALPHDDDGRRIVLSETFLPVTCLSSSRQDMEFVPDARQAAAGSLPSTEQNSASDASGQKRLGGSSNDSGNLRALTATCPHHPNGRLLCPVFQTSVYPFRDAHFCCVCDEVYPQPCGKSDGTLFTCTVLREDGVTTCGFAACPKHYRGSLREELTAEGMGFAAETSARGAYWVSATVIVTAAITLYVPIVRTAMLIVACNPQFQCQFECALMVDRDYTLAFFLSVVTMVFFGFGFPAAICVVLVERTRILHSMFSQLSNADDVTTGAPSGHSSSAKHEADENGAAGETLSSTSASSFRESREWALFCSADPSVLGTLYKSLEYRWVFLNPILMAFKVVLLSPVVFLAPGTLSQSIGIAVVELVFAAFTAATSPFTSSLVNVMYRFGSVHQLLFLGIQNFDTVSRYDLGNTLGGYQGGLLAVTSIYLAFTLGLTAWLSIGSVLLEHWKKRQVEATMKSIGHINSSETTLYLDPSFAARPNDAVAMQPPQRPEQLAAQNQRGKMSATAHSDMLLTSVDSKDQR